MESFRDAIVPVDSVDAPLSADAAAAALAFDREFDEFMHSPSEERKQALVKRLSRFGAVPQAARATLAQVLLQKLEEPTLRHEMADGKSMSRHTLNALLSLGYPWALEVPAETLERIEEAERGSTSIFTAKNVTLGFVVLALVLVHLIYGAALLANSHYPYTQFLGDVWKNVTQFVLGLL